MKHSPDQSHLDWAKRVNHAWIVRENLNENAESWLDHLAALDDGRLERSCKNARAMCDLRDHTEDPKPWFYAGLFSLATADEARRFLKGHRITRAAIPAMADDEGVQLWMDRIGPDTRELLDRLRHGITHLNDATDGVD